MTQQFYSTFHDAPFQHVPTDARPRDQPRSPLIRWEQNARRHVTQLCSVHARETLRADMATLSRLERLRLAARRLREIEIEAAAIYRNFPELDRRPNTGRGQRLSPIAEQQARARRPPDQLG